MEFRTGKRLSSPFSKGGPRPARHRSRSGEAGGGILLRGRPPEDHRYILTVQAKPNYTTCTSVGRMVSASAEFIRQLR